MPAGEHRRLEEDAVSLPQWPRPGRSSAGNTRRAVTGSDPVAALADWVADLQETVQRARHRRHLILAAGSAGALMLTTVGVALATDQVRPEVPRLALPASSPPVAADVPPWTEPSPSGQPVTRVTPATAPGGLTVWARTAGDTVLAGQPLAVELTWRDEDGRLIDVTQDWGDGAQLSAPRARGCDAPAGATGGTATFRHAWRTAGAYTVRFAVTTATCDGRTEKRFVSFLVRVVSAPDVHPTPTPPTPLPKPTTPSPAPTTPLPSPTSPVPTTSPTPTVTTAPTGEPTDPTGEPTGEPPVPTVSQSPPTPSPELSSSSASVEPSPTSSS